MNPARILGMVAMMLGVLIALIDRAAPFGDDSAKFTIVLWLLFSGLLGFALPRHPWRWAALMGPWLCLVNLLIHALGLPDSVHPTTYAAILILLPVSLVVCLLGAYDGPLARAIVVPPRLS